MGLNTNSDRNAHSMNVADFFQKDQFIPVVQSLAAVFGIISNAEKSEAAHFFE